MKIFKILGFSILLIFVQSCGSNNNLYTKVKQKGCENVRYINLSEYSKRDTTGFVLKKDLNIVDNILSKTLSLGQDTILDQSIKFNKSSVTTRILNTTEEVVSAYNAKINLLCDKQQQLLEMMENSKLTDATREKASNMYFQILEDYKEFSDVLESQLKKK